MSVHLFAPPSEEELVRRRKERDDALIAKFSQLDKLAPHWRPFIERLSADYDLSEENLKQLTEALTHAIVNNLEAVDLYVRPSVSARFINCSVEIRAVND